MTGQPTAAPIGDCGATIESGDWRLYCRAYGLPQSRHVCILGRGHEGVCTCRCGEAWSHLGRLT